MKTLKTTEKVEVTTRSGGKYSYKYTDIAAIHDYLETISANYYQYIDRLEGDDYIMTVKTVDGKEQAPIRGCRVVQATLQDKSNPAQEQGSALTYARRYSLLMAFGLATEDDDAESLTKKPEMQSYQKTKTFNPKPTIAPQNGHESACSRCGDEVTEKVAKYSAEKFGEVLCFDCQKLN